MPATSGGLNLPSDLHRSFFAYGAMKPNELAFHRVAEFVHESSVDSLKGALYSRDGLPTLHIATHGSNIDGVVLKFEPKDAELAYQSICDFEPSRIYKWEEATTTSGKGVNVLVGRGKVGSVYEALENGLWTSKSDPVFREGLNVIKDVARNDATDEFSSSVLNEAGWKRYFRCQMAYLLLFSAIERYVSLSHGPGIGPVEKEKALGADEHFSAALKIHGQPPLEPIRDARNRSGGGFKFEPNNPLKSAKYLYQIRHNLSHRGKGAWNEAEKVRCALLRASAIFETMLESAWSVKP